MNHLFTFQLYFRKPPCSELAEILGTVSFCIAIMLREAPVGVSPSITAEQSVRTLRKAAIMEAAQSLYLNLFGEDKVHVLKELLHACVDEICGRPGPSYYRFANSIEWSKAEYEETYQLISMLLRNPACLYLSDEKMPQEYHELPEHIQQTILTCLRVRREQLTDALLKEYSKEKCDTLTDFDWRLKLVMGSSKLASLREPLLQLDLMVENKETKRMLGLELNKDELETFINAMETIVQ